MNDNHNCFSIELADVIIRVESPTLRTKFQCLQYLTEKQPDVYVSINKEDVEREIFKLEELGFVNKDKCYRLDDRNISIYINEINEPFLESALVLQKISEALIPYDIILMHGAVVATGNNAYMFTAPSGTGKTTHIRKWLKNDECAFVVNGDKPLIKISENKAIAYGTPWCGKEHMGANTKVPLKAVVIMQRSEKNHIEEISFPEAYPLLLQQTFIPVNEQFAKNALDILAKLYKKVHFYKFRFNNFNDDCFSVSYNMLVRDLR